MVRNFFSQQVRYMRSTKDTPDRKFGRKKFLDQIALDVLAKPKQDFSEYEDYEAVTTDITKET